MTFGTSCEWLCSVASQRPLPSLLANLCQLHIAALLNYQLARVAFTTRTFLRKFSNMAEAIGIFASALTISALFKACVDAFDLVQAARHQEADYNRLLVKFNIEKCRLYTWGQMMGLTSTSQCDEPRHLDSFQFKGLVVQTLQTLHDLFNDSERIQERYGCRKATALAIAGGEEEDLTNPLAAAFLHFQNGLPEGRGLKMGQKARWVIRDRKKFAELVSHIKELVDGLQEITKSMAPIVLQESAMTKRITTITDVDTLQLVSEICEEDHAAFSRAASLKSEILSMSDTDRLKIEAWLADETPLLDPETIDLENMNLPELKHQMLSLLKKRQQLEDDYTNLIRLSKDQNLYHDDYLDSIVAKQNHESASMNIISLATLVGLPGTFVSSIMSMSYFENGVLNNTGFWMYWAMTVPLTATTVVTYLLMRRRPQDKLMGNARRTKSIPLDEYHYT